LNAYAERFVRSIKEECLNRMIFIGQASLRRAVSEYMSHYHAERNHQGLENSLIRAMPSVAANEGRYIAVRGSADCSTSTIGKRPERHRPELWTLRHAVQLPEATTAPV
jgi:hypothetical protein